MFLGKHPIWRLHHKVGDAQVIRLEDILSILHASTVLTTVNRRLYSIDQTSG